VCVPTGTHARSPARAGDTCSDLDLSDAGSVTGSEPDSDDSASDASGYFGGSGRAASAAATPADEFVVEVRLSLERAFAEGHSLDNAAVELKTLRMASNVPIARVRGAVVGAIVDRVPLVEGDAAAQRAQIVKLVQRWGALVNRIGGVDQVDAISALQVRAPAPAWRRAVLTGGPDALRAHGAHAAVRPAPRRVLPGGRRGGAAHPAVARAPVREGRGPPGRRRPREREEVLGGRRRAHQAV
jgi:hypothetical protein